MRWVQEIPSSGDGERGYNPGKMFDVCSKLSIVMALSTTFTQYALEITKFLKNKKIV